MNRTQKIILLIGLALILLHIGLYFPGVHSKYQKVQFEKQRLLLESDQQTILRGVENKQRTFNRVLIAWSSVSIVLISTTGILIWLLRTKSKRSQI